MANANANKQMRLPNFIPLLQIERRAANAIKSIRVKRAAVNFLWINEQKTACLFLLILQTSKFLHALGSKNMLSDCKGKVPLH